MSCALCPAALALLWPSCSPEAPAEGLWRRVLLGGGPLAPAWGLQSSGPAWASPNRKAHWPGHGGQAASALSHPGRQVKGPHTRPEAGPGGRRGLEEALGYTPHLFLHPRPPRHLELYPGRLWGIPLTFPSTSGLQAPWSRTWGRLWDPWTLCVHLRCAQQARQQRQRSGQPSKHRTEPLLLNTKYPPGRPTQQSLLQQEACGRTGQASHGGALPGNPWGKAEGPGVGRWWGPA